MTAAVLSRPAPAVVPGYDPCGGSGRVFRGGRFPESCPLGCPPEISAAGTCCECGHTAGCDCACCPYPLPA